MHVTLQTDTISYDRRTNATSLRSIGVLPRRCQAVSTPEIGYGRCRL